jgi:hypothetical protein
MQAISCTYGELGMRLVGYMEQIEQAATASGVDLSQAFRRAGVALTTHLRWASGRHHPRHTKAEEIMAAIAALAAESGRQGVEAGSAANDTSARH